MVSRYKVRLTFNLPILPEKPSHIADFCLQPPVGIYLKISSGIDAISRHIVFFKLQHRL